MNRNPHQVKKAIRQADGFVCAYPGCNIPFLEYHHFDPPWEIEQHNNPAGIIALCPNHHRMADGGVFTTEQIRAFKTNAFNNYESVKYTNHWLRNRMGIILGSNLAIDNRVEFAIAREPVIWFNESTDGYKLLNINLKNYEGKQIFAMSDNNWEVYPGVVDIECTTQHRSIRVQFDEVDKIEINFKEFINHDYFIDTYPNFNSEFVKECIVFPLTIITINGSLYSGRLKLSHKLMDGPGVISMKNGITGGNQVGFSL